jgi:putative tricarboxylic transport membrane protein
MAEFISGISGVLDPLVILFIFIGVFVGIVFGSIPGLTATMAIVMFLPVTYTMTSVQGMSMLMALYIGGISGGLISAILLNIPGTPSSIATTFDGRPMALKGQAGKALGTGVVFSFCGTIIGIAVLMVAAPVIAALAIKFGPYEYCTLSLCALSLVISLTGRDLVKGLVSGLLGVMFATVGLAPIDSAKRFTFGIVELNSGFALLTLLIGLFAVTEVIKAAEEVRKPINAKLENQDVRIKGFGFTLKEFLEQKWNLLRSSFIGIVIGILPGIGGAISGMLSYTAAKNQSKHPEKFGTGIMDGIVASESANNAGIGGAMIPMLTMGIPGDAATAMLLGGLMVHQIAPGPLIFEKSAADVYGIYGAMIVAAFAMLFLELFGIRIFIRVLKLKKYWLMPIIMVLCTVGAFGNANRMFDVWSVLAFGAVGYALLKVGIPHVPMILGFILGPIFELNFRRAVQHYQISPTEWMSHPIAIFFFVFTIFVIVYSLIRQRKEAKLGDQANQNISEE